MNSNNIKNKGYIDLPNYIRNLKPYKETPQDPWFFKKKNSVSKVDWNEGTFIPFKIN